MAAEYVEVVAGDLTAYGSINLVIGIWLGFVRSAASEKICDLNVTAHGCRIVPCRPTVPHAQQDQPASAAWWKRSCGSSCMAMPGIPLRRSTCTAACCHSTGASHGTGRRMRMSCCAASQTPWRAAYCDRPWALTHSGHQG